MTCIYYLSGLKFEVFIISWSSRSAGQHASGATGTVTGRSVTDLKFGSFPFSSNLKEEWCLVLKVEFQFTNIDHEYEVDHRKKSK